jgi:riboflavin-specific deaminase-like protein
MDTLFPLPGMADAPLESVLEHYAYPPIAGARWWMRANMLSSVDGAVTGPDGRSGSLSTAVDRQVFHHLRAQADAIVVGAGTARDENYGPVNVDEQTSARRVAAGQAARPRLVVVTRSLSLDPDARLFSGADRVTVVTSRSAPWPQVERLGEVADVLRVGDDTVDLAELVGVLADQGLPQLLCEGGPALLGDIVADGLLDELCWTLVPTLVGSDARRIVAGRSPDPLLGLSLASMARADDGTLFSRWLRA